MTLVLVRKRITMKTEGKNHYICIWVWYIRVKKNNCDLLLAITLFRIELSKNYYFKLDT